MDYRREAADTLRHCYNDWQMSIINLKEEITILSAELGGSSICYKETSGGNGNTEASDNITLNKILRKDQAQKELKITRSRINRIDRILNQISEDIGCEKYGTVLRHWFIERRDKECIADDLKYSVRQLYNIRDKALKKFARQMYGAKVE